MKRKRTMHTITATLLVIMMTLSIMTGCTTQSESTTTESPSKTTTTEATEDTTESTTENAVEEPFDLSIFSIYYGAEYPDLEDSVFTAFEEALNVKIAWDLVPNGSLTEKFDVKLASRDLAMVNRISSLKAPNVISATENGAFWVVEDYLDDTKYPYLAEMSNIIIDQSRVNGQYVFLTSERPVGRPTVLYRKDLAEAHGISEVPQTVDEFYDLIVALSEDCDFGFTLSQILPPNNQWAELSRMAVWFGAPNGYGLVDGTLAYAPTTQGWIDAMDFVKRLYDEGLINTDFAAINDSQTREFFKAGKAGAMHISAGDIQSFENSIQEITPDAELAGFGGLDAGQGKRAIMGAGQGGAYGISTDMVKDEESLARVLQFFDESSSPEMKQLAYDGLIGIHCDWVEEGKTIEVTIDADRKNRTVNVLWQVNMALNSIAAEPARVIDPRIDALRAENAEYGVVNVVTPYTSETYNNIGIQLDNIIVDATTKYIFGEVDLDEYKAEMDKWLAQGGDKILEEYQTQYNQYN